MFELYVRCKIQACTSVCSVRYLCVEGVDGQHHAPAALTPEERTCKRCTGGLLGLGPGLNGDGKSRCTLGFDPQALKLVASRYKKYMWAYRVFEM